MLRRARTSGANTSRTGTAWAAAVAHRFVFAFFVLVDDALKFFEKDDVVLFVTSLFYFVVEDVCSTSKSTCTLLLFLDPPRVASLTA